MIQELDPNSMRTVLCLTKMDLYTEIGLKQKIDNCLLDYELDESNFFMIRNRTQEEMNQNMTLE